jgi:hypothetical protein
MADLSNTPPAIKVPGLTLKGFGKAAASTEIGLAVGVPLQRRGRLCGRDTGHGENGNDCRYSGTTE